MKMKTISEHGAEVMKMKTISEHGAEVMKMKTISELGAKVRKMKTISELGAKVMKNTLRNFSLAEYLRNLNMDRSSERCCVQLNRYK
jgi:hypothetical protein